MPSFINPPQDIPFYLKVGLWYAEREAGAEMLPARLLAWYPKAAISSGILESLIAHDEGEINERMLKIVRLQASFAVSCPFCIDMNSVDHEKLLTQDELAALQGRVDVETVATLTKREKLAMRYTQLISQTPLKFPKEFMEELAQNFSEREIVILATTAAQVNYWARLIQALGVPPVGMNDQCEVPLKN